VSADYFREQLRITCAMREIPAPVLDDDAVASLVERVRRASQEWRELAAGDAMEFDLAG
jgi:hypothetical protein